MQFQTGHLYHVYNQGNNRRPIFFSQANYIFFLKKMRELVLPNVRFLAWCLMPNHYHWMILIPESADNLNQAIGKLQSSYTAAINKQEQTSGSLFRQHFQAECITAFQGLRPSFIGNKILITPLEKAYPQVCFDYIHNNPVAANIVKAPQDWEFSSFRDVVGLRNGTLVDLQEIEKRGLNRHLK